MIVDATDVALIRQTFERALLDGGGDAVDLLGELGWWELHQADPAVATAELFEAQGRLGRGTGALDAVVALAAGVALPAGSVVVHPTPGGWDRACGRFFVDGAVHFDGLVLAGFERAVQLVVPFEDGDGVGLGVLHVERGAADAGLVRARPVPGIDPRLALVAVTGETPLPDGVAQPASGSWTFVASAAQRALAHELCGLTGSMLTQAAAYVTERHQFGRPIAAFQTVRHRLTDIFVALASARAALDASWLSDDPLLADVAKALAGKAGLLAARHCLQVTGAIGFTEEYGLAERIRRIHLLDRLYGGVESLTARLGDRLLAERTVPRFQPLP